MHVNDTGGFAKKEDKDFAITISHALQHTLGAQLNTS